MINVTRRENFSAAHKLFNPKWSAEKNQEVFGKCSNPNWHGHNYTLYVTVRGKVNQETGYSINLKELSIIIRTSIIDKIDHKNLNMDVDFLKNLMPSTENIAIAIWKELEPHVNAFNCELYCIKLCETENNYVEYFGEQ